MSQNNAPAAVPFTPAEDMRMRELQRNTAALKKTMEPLLNTAPRTIEESDFIKYFLPLFSGFYGNDRVAIQAALVKWYETAGTPYAPVDIVKDGQIVAQVPAIKSSILDSRPKRGGMGPGAMMHLAEQASTVAPKMAQNQLHVQLHNRYMTQLQRPQLTPLQQKWEALLARYGKSLEPGKAAAAPGGKAATSSSDDDLIYD